jgi:hypothetical protein
MRDPRSWNGPTQQPVVASAVAGRPGCHAEILESLGAATGTRAGGGDTRLRPGDDTRPAKTGGGEAGPVGGASGRRDLRHVGARPDRGRAGRLRPRSRRISPSWCREPAKRGTAPPSFGNALLCDRLPVAVPKPPAPTTPSHQRAVRFAAPSRGSRPTARRLSATRRPRPPRRPWASPRARSSCAACGSAGSGRPHAGCLAAGGSTWGAGRAGRSG